MSRDETTCEKCGGPNPDWLAPEFVALVGSRSGIVCPTCFTTLDPTAHWVVTRLARDDQQRARLADVLRGCVTDQSDADRLAGCVIDAGWRLPAAGGMDPADPSSDTQHLDEFYDFPLSMYCRSCGKPGGACCCVPADPETPT